MSQWGGAQGQALTPRAHHWRREHVRSLADLEAESDTNPMVVVERLNDGSWRAELRSHGLHMVRVADHEPPDHCALHRPDWSIPGGQEQTPHRPDPRVVATFLYQWRRGN